MLLLCLVFFSIVSKLSGIPFVDSTDFNVKIADIVDNQYAGDPTFLKKFLLQSGDPKGLRNSTNYQSPSYCYDIQEKVIFEEKYTDCLVLESNLTNGNRTRFQLGKISPFGFFKFVVNLISLKNIEVELKNHNELVYFYLSAFEKCDNCLFNLVENHGLVGIKFGRLYEIDMSQFPDEHRPRLFIRGNPLLEFDRRKRKQVKSVCHKTVCTVQENRECVFRQPIRTDQEYQSCKSVYGNMTFNARFQIVQPVQTNFLIDGCFVFNNTGIRFIRPFLRAIPSCPYQHVFENNRLMCTDQLNELIRHWGKEKVKVISNYSEVNCYQGECRGGFISENNPHRYVGCEIVQGNLFINNKSGPSLLISNMTNLRKLIFHPNVEFQCNTSGPVIVISNTPKLHLYQQELRQMTSKSYQFEGFDYKLNNYGLDLRTWILLAISLLIVASAELFKALRSALLLPNFIYRRYPMKIEEKLPKAPSTPKDDSDSELVA